MKSLILIITFVIITTANVYSQSGWEWVVPKPHGNNLNDIQFVNANTGWTVSNLGFISKTINGGINWTISYSNAAYDFYGLHFVNENYGWVAGTFGSVVSTSDGGVNWIFQSVGTSNRLTSVHFVNESTGWVTGFGGVIRKTTNGGLSWLNQSSGTSNDLNSVQFLDANTGWVVGNSGTIRKTTDGGASWFAQTSGTGNEFLSAYFLNSNTGWAVGYSSEIRKTTNGGENWESRFTIFWGKSIQFINENTGMIAGSGGVQRTTNGGDNWSWVVSDFIGYNSLNFTNADTIWVAGEWGGLLRSTNGGINWFRRNTIINQNFFQIQFANPNTGWAVGSSSEIRKTTNGGISWILQSGVSSNTINAMSFINENTGWIAYSNGGIQKTFDGGASWQVQSSGTTNSLNWIQFLNLNTGWAVGDGGIIRKTTNSGVHWFAQTSGITNSLWSVHFLNENTGWAVGSSGIVRKTTDGGINWFAQTSGTSSTLWTAQFLNENTGWIAGTSGNIRKTTDGGTNWIAQTSGTNNSLFSVHFLNENTGWAVGDGGTIRKTTTGGNEWIPEVSYTDKNLRSIIFIDGTAWVAGHNGTILKSSSISTPNLVSPLNNSIGLSLEPTLDWSDVSNAVSYRVQVSTDQAFSNLVYNEIVSESQAAIPPGILSASTEYHWRVNAFDGVLTSDYTSPWKFYTICTKEWEVVIRASDAGGANDSVRFGTSSGATNGLDICLGEQELPPVPPSGVFDFRFVLPVTPPIPSRSDYRSDTNQTINWRMTFQPASSYPMTFTWEPSLLPTGSFILKDEVTGTIVNVNMKSQNSYTLTNTGITSLRIEYAQTLTIPVNVTTEWNIVSVPVLAADMSTTNLFPGATTPAFGFSNGYINATTLVNGKGYFLKFAGPNTFDITGSNVLPKEIPVESGWNIVGPFETSVNVSSITSNPPGIISSTFFGYNNGYVSATSLQPGKGYWIKTTQAGTLILPDVMDNIPENVVSADEDRSSWTTLRLKESNGSGEMELYLAKPDELTSSSYELPPVPPHGIFDVRYASNNYAEPIGMNHMIKINSTEYPVEIRAENLNGLVLRVKDKVTGEIVNAQLTEGVSIMIPHPIEMLDIIIENSIPTEYSLSQNYPNPFNPITKIHYAIPHEGMVTLQVYDITGREVTRLVNETKSAGYYHVDFDASGLSSGVYFYRIHSGSYSNVKRMLLLK